MTHMLKNDSHSPLFIQEVAVLPVWTSPAWTRLQKPFSLLACDDSIVFPCSGEVPNASDVDCVDLVVNPTMGLTIVDECEKLGIANIFIQPGAGSQELIERARGKDIAVREGCVLVELPAPNL